MWGSIVAHGHYDYGRNNGMLAESLWKEAQIMYAHGRRKLQWLTYFIGSKVTLLFIFSKIICETEVVNIFLGGVLMKNNHGLCSNNR